jgi:hypothetical protein
MKLNKFRIILKTIYKKLLESLMKNRFMSKKLKELKSKSIGHDYIL